MFYSGLCSGVESLSSYKPLKAAEPQSEQKEEKEDRGGILELLLFIRGTANNQTDADYNAVSDMRL